jgi:hypothetical protein
MLTAVPQSVFSWNYVVNGVAGGPATVAFEVFGEQGGIFCNGQQYAIHKHGWLSGHWTMQLGDENYAEAMKESAVYRAFEVHDGTALYELAAKNPFRRGYLLSLGGQCVGRIEPTGPFTRQTVVDCDQQVPEPTQLFCLWLAALTWRRASRSNVSATG